MSLSKHLYRSLAGMFPDAVFILDKQNKIVFANNQTAVLFGFDYPDNLNGKDILSFIHPANHDDAICSLQKVLTLDRNKKERFKYTFIRNDGGTFAGETNLSLIESPDENYISLIVKDVTEVDNAIKELKVRLREILEVKDKLSIEVSRQKVEIDTKSADSYNRSLIETSLDPLVTIGPNGKITDVNAATESVTGCSRSELIGTDFSNYFTQPDKARAGYQEVFQKGLVHDYALEIRHRDGHITPVLYNASVYRDNSGNAVGVFAAARDITERRRAEKELDNYRMHLEELVNIRSFEWETANNKLQAEITERKKAEEVIRRSQEQIYLIANAVPALISYIDKDYYYRWANEGYSQLLGLDNKNIQDHHVREVLGEIEWQKNEPHLKKAFSGKKVVLEDYWKIPDGSYRWVQKTYTPDCDETGCVHGVVIHAMDITARKKAEDQIQQHIINLEFLSKAGLYFLKISPDQDILSYIGKQLNNIVPNAVIVVNSYDSENNSITVQGVYGRQDDIKNIENTFGQNPVGLTLKVFDNYRNMMIEGELQKVPKGLYGLHFPIEFCRNMEEQLGLADIYTMPFTVYGDILGTVAILSRKKEPFNETRIIEAFMGMAAIAVGRWRAEEKILKEKKYSDTLINNLPGIFYALNNNGKMLQTNNMFSVISEYSPEEIAYMKGMDFFSGGDKKLIEDWIQEVFQKGESTVEASFLSRNGKAIPCYFTGSRIMKDGKPILIGMGIDITERKQWEEKIEASLKEKEILLKEIHHRVKNNLQIISSILSLQSNYIQDKAANDVFYECQNRVKSMALIHEKLYLSGNISNINIKEYVNDISVKLFSSFNHAFDHIDLKLNVEDIYLDVDISIAIGLILNELISNSLKHAFKSGTDGVLKINIYREKDKLILIVSDNGVGLPKDYDFENSKTLGLLLVSSLIDQHKGKMEVDNSNGTTFKISF